MSIFLATHKSSFKQSYINVQTGQTELKEHNKYLKITLEELMGHIRQIVSYICLKLFGGTMCIMKIFMINSSNQWSQYFIFTVILSIYIWYRHPGVWYLQVTPEEKVSDVPGSSLGPSVQVISHIMSSKSQLSSQGTLPPREENVRM